MLGLGWQELVIVLVIIMIIFGAGKLPEVARSLGQGVKEFRQESAGGTDGLAAATGSGSEALDSATVSATTAQTSERAKVRADEI
jgi:sec-independent protein translocase protein TatA